MLKLCTVKDMEMKQELQNSLFKKYPKIFRQRVLPKQSTAMCWGIACGDGWYDLIDALCFSIQYWVDHGNVQVEAVQVKSKWGGLRFYVNNSCEYVDGLIAMAEHMSYKIKEMTPKEKFLIKENSNESAL